MRAHVRPLDAPGMEAYRQNYGAAAPYIKRIDDDVKALQRVAGDFYEGSEDFLSLQRYNIMFRVEASIPEEKNYSHEWFVKMSGDSVGNDFKYIFTLLTSLRTLSVAKDNRVDKVALKKAVIDQAASPELNVELSFGRVNEIMKTIETGMQVVKEVDEDYKLRYGLKGALKSYISDREKI